MCSATSLPFFGSCIALPARVCWEDFCSGAKLRSLADLALHSCKPSSFAAGLFWLPVRVEIKFWLLVGRAQEVSEALVTEISLPNF